MFNDLVTYRLLCLVAGWQSKALLLLSEGHHARRLLGTARHHLHPHPSGRFRSCCHGHSHRRLIRESSLGLNIEKRSV